MTPIAVSYQHVGVPTEVFLAQVLGGIGVINGIRVERLSPNNVTIHHRHTPGWAVIFGLIGLLFFLLGALLWFIKRTDTISVIAQDAPGGCTVTITGQGPVKVVGFLNGLVKGDAERIYAELPG